MSFSLRLTCRPGFLWLAMLCICTAGCTQDDGIRQYTVEKLPEREKSADSAEPFNSQPQDAWFFKLTGPTDEVLRQIVPFSQLVRSFELSPAGVPQYTIANGWTASDGPPPRYQTLKIEESDPPLEVTVSSLPGPASGLDRFLLANINRWRGQLGLDPMDSSDWLEESRNSGELLLMPSGGNLLAIVNLVGTTKDFGETRMLAAVVLPKPESAKMSSSAPSPQAPAKPPLEFKAPDGWTATAGNAMRLASFEASHDSGKADISVTRLGGGGDIAGNVNRWRKQVDLPELDSDQLKEDLQEINIGGKPATFVEAIGGKQSILAAIVPDGDAKWFFKMQGPREVVAAEADHFREFLKSVKFEMD